MRSGPPLDTRCDDVRVSDLVPRVAAGPARRWWSILRIAVVVIWLFAAAATWWTSPREQSYDQARTDLAAGRVTAYQWGDRWVTDRSERWFGGASLQLSGKQGPVFAWRTPNGQIHWVDTYNFDHLTIAGAVDEQNYSGPGAVRIAQDIQAAGLEHLGRDIYSIGPGPSWPGFVLLGLGLGVLVAGPAPTRGTRWFWFWLVLMVPYGIGMLLWLGRERPWSDSAPPPAAFPSPERRDRGILGFCLAVLAGLLISVLLLVLHSVFGDRWVPSPDA